MSFLDILTKFHRRDGGYLVRRYISFLGHLVAMVIVMKLTWAGGMTEGYFTIYVSFIAAHATMEKYIARKSSIPGVDIETDPDPVPKPRAGKI